MAQTVLVTGAASSIGRAVVERLATHGHRIAAADTAKQLSELKEHLKKIKGDIARVEVDVTKAEHRKELFQKVESALGPIDSLIICPGQNPSRGNTIDETCAGMLDKVMTQYVTTPFRLAQQGMDSLQKSKNGSIVFFGSIGGFQPMIDLGMYSVASSAVLALTKAVAMSAAAKKVRANAVISGMIDGDGSSAVWDSGFEIFENESIAKTREAIPQMIPLGRLGQPADIAGAVSFLISPNARYITGENLVLSGGVQVRF